MNRAADQQSSSANKAVEQQSNRVAVFRNRGFRLKAEGYRINFSLQPSAFSLIPYFCFTALLLCCSIILTTAHAEELIKKGEVLSLKRCIEIALKKQPNISAATGSKSAAESRVGQAKASYYPQIEIGTGYSRTHTRDTFNQYSGTLSIRQNIYDFGRTEAGVKIQGFNLDASKAELDNTVDGVIFDVTQAYYNLIKAKRNRDVALEVVKQYEGHLIQAKGLYEAGTRPRYDVTQAEVNLSNARLNLIKAENAVKLAIASLNNSMGVHDAPEYEVEDDLQFRKIEVTLSDALSSALKNRPDLRSIISKRRAAEQSVELARRNYNPTISGTINYGWGGNNFPLEREWNLGATLTIPIFNGYLTRYQVAEAEANLYTIKANEDLLKQNIYVEVQQAYLNLKEAEERIPAAELAVRQATENLELARGRYEAGVGNPIEVTDAETSYVNARVAYIQALIDYRISIAAIEKAMGKGYEESAYR